jgi:hypothetical protein
MPNEKYKMPITDYRTPNAKRKTQNAKGNMPSEILDKTETKCKEIPDKILKQNLK